MIFIRNQCSKRLTRKRSNYKFDRWGQGVKFKVSNVRICDGGSFGKLKMPPIPPNCKRSDRVIINQRGRGKADFASFLYANNQERITE